MNNPNHQPNKAGAVELDETVGEIVEDDQLDHAVGGHGYLFDPPSRQRVANPKD